ncbi:Alpha beta-hydrolase [Mycena venus]|uniref:Alpha beta-hydrolase n=1 Tax=Mycena venus TaxID=2733690 RepID=A0A8H7CRD0_9AGAR|nr:Alpha beta-hydrolase [Mycena venus]
MKWFTSHLPWKSFSPAVLRIIEDTYFIPDPDRPGYITTKTSVEQEIASFVDDGTHVRAIPFLLTILDVLPTHIIMGSINDLLSATLYDLGLHNTQQVRSRFASLTFMEEVGHYLPVVKPRAIAKQNFKSLQIHGPSKL